MPLPLAAESAPHSSVPMFRSCESVAVVRSLLPSPAARTSARKRSGPGGAAVAVAGAVVAAAVCPACVLPPPHPANASATQAMAAAIGDPRAHDLLPDLVPLFCGHGMVEPPSPCTHRTATARTRQAAAARHSGKRRSGRSPFGASSSGPNARQGYVRVEPGWGTFVVP